MDELICQRSKVLRVPRADCTPGSNRWASYLFGPGKWISILDACFLLSPLEASKVVVNVARRAGLNIPDVPSHVLQVGMTQANFENYLNHSCGSMLFAVTNFLSCSEQIDRVVNICGGKRSATRT